MAGRGRGSKNGDEDAGPLDGGVPEIDVPQVGRPKKLEADEKTIKLIGNLGAIQCTAKEAAGVLGVHENTFNDFREANPAVQAAWEKGKENGRASLRRSQFKLAEKNATMAIFLGMQYLNQKDLRGQWGWRPPDGDSGKAAPKIKIEGGLPEPGTPLPPPEPDPTLDAAEVPHGIPEASPANPEGQPRDKTRDNSGDNGGQLS